MRTKVILVEDSAEVRRLIARVLRMLDCDVVECRETKEAFELVRAQRPDLLLTDVFVGTESGLDLITRIRSDLAPPHPRFIVASGVPAMANEAAQRGVGVFLPKPFSLEVVRDALATALAEKQPDAELRTAAEQAAVDGRAAARDAARAAIERLLPKWDELVERAEWTIDWLPRYLGFGGAALALLDEAHLREICCTNHTTPSLALDDARLRLAVHVMETSSAIVLSDASSLVAPPSAGGKSRLRFFTGVPLLAGLVPVGALYLFDEKPHALEVEDYDLLIALGSRASARLGGEGDDASWPFWEHSGLLTAEAFEVVFAGALRRARRLEGELAIADVEIHAPSDRAGWLRSLGGAISLERVAIAERASDRFGILVFRGGRDEAARDLKRAIDHLAERGELVAGGWLTVEGRNLPPLSEHELIRLVDSIASRARRAGKRCVEGIRLRHETSLEDAAE